jgi:gamma-glutamylcyclotransferase (GGCT)/AIG2-like uncharacterized protein YtfP
MTNPGVYQLFVYGSLRSGFHSPVYEYISRFFTFVGEAKVKGKLFDLGEYPAAIPAEEDFFIIGELYTAKNQQEFSWAIGQLDDYEGLNVEEGETPLYKRKVTEVYINDQVKHAWVYWYNGDVSGKPVIASGDILEFLKNKK